MSESEDKREQKKLELEKEYALAGRHEEAIAERKVQLKAQLAALGVDPEPGAAGGPGVLEAAKQEDELAGMLDKLSPAELTRLFTTDRATWQRIMDAQEAVGWRKLMGTNY